MLSSVLLLALGLLSGVALLAVSILKISGGEYQWIAGVVLTGVGLVAILAAFRRSDAARRWPTLLAADQAPQDDRLRYVRMATAIRLLLAAASAVGAFVAWLIFR